MKNVLVINDFKYNILNCKEFYLQFLEPYINNVFLEDNNKYFSTILYSYNPVIANKLDNLLEQKTIIDNIFENKIDFHNVDNTETIHKCEINNLELKKYNLSSLSFTN